ncbi:MAG TPA: 30S ribosomal protein S6 [Bacteroidota bacterium]|nr:30S ribosomal protein S6 [Bacteroidota bacterium]
MDKPKKQYETTFIVNASLDDSQIEGVISRVQEVVTRNGGTVTAINKWGRKRLAYSINKKTNGFYVNMELEAPGTMLTALDRAYQLDEMILRHLTILLDRKALAARQAAAVAAAAAAAAALNPPPEAAPVPTREPQATGTVTQS